MEGQDLDSGQILCISPEMSTFGRVAVTLEITHGALGERPENVIFYASE